MTAYVILTFLFVLPFVDPRHPFRLVHLDVLALALFGLYFLRYMDRGGTGSLRLAVTVANAGLLYLLVRTLLIGFRPRRREDALLPVIPAWLLGVAALLLTVVHLGFPLYDDERPVIDVGLSSVLGAERILAGRDLYGAEGYHHPELHPDTYGPVTYLLYVPFARALPEPNLYAARAAAGAFDLLTVIGLFLLGRNLRRGGDGTRLGFILAYAWAAFPYTFFVTAWAYNDALVALCLVTAMLVISSPLSRGLVLGLGTAAKFVPAVVAPLFVTGAGGSSRRSLLVSIAAFTAVIAMAFAPFIPDGGLRELYERMAGWQIERQSTTSIWGQYPSIEWLRPVLRAAVIAFALALAFVPRRRNPVQIAALATAAILAFELSLGHWLPSYVVWFAPVAFVAFFAGGFQRSAEYRASGA